MEKLKAVCSLCGKTAIYPMTKAEERMLIAYKKYGRELGMLQELFPKIPAWIRSGAIDTYSNGFCICPVCSGEE